MLKKIIFFLSLFSLTFSCSDKEIDSLGKETEVENPISENKTFPLTLVSSGESRNFYEMVMFGLKDSTYEGPNGAILIPIKYETLDSLTWEVEGSSKKKNLLMKTSGGYNFTTAWGHFFYLPGNYKTYLRGYRGSEIVIKDSTEVRISSTGDFLHIKWSDLQEKPAQNIGYTNNGTSDFQFSVYNGKIGSDIFAKLNVRFDELDYWKFNPEIGKRELGVFTSYISSLYGQPKYHEAGTVTYAEYKKLFKKSAKEEQVIKIWLAGNSNIALLKKDSWEENGFGYEIHAEPNK